jgi:hypothetical protein
MANLDYKNKKNVSIYLIKILKSPDFFNRLEEFDDIFNKAKIDINKIIDKKRLTNFLEYAISDSKKFFYLVQKYGANYHAIYENKEYSFIPSVKLLNDLKYLNTQFSSFDKTYEEEKKILEHIKKDKYTWIDEVFTTLTKEDKKVIKRTTFFESFFVFHVVKKEDIENVLQIHFDEIDKKEKFEFLKKELFFTLLDKSILHYTRELSHKDRISPVVNLETILPYLKNHNLITLDDKRTQDMVVNMFSKQLSLDIRKIDSLDIIDCLLKNKIISLDFLNKIDFSQIYISHVFEKIQTKIEYYQKNLKDYQHAYDSGYVSYSPNIFESTLNALDRLEKMGVKTYITKDNKIKLLEILAIMEGKKAMDSLDYESLNQQQKENVEKFKQIIGTSGTMPRTYEQRRYTQYDLIKELIILKHESTDINTHKASIKKMKI